MTSIEFSVFQFVIQSIKIKIYRTIIFLVVPNGCEAPCFTLREERRLRMSGNRVMRKLFEPKREEVTGQWKSLHHEELHALCSSPNIDEAMK